MFAKCQVIIYRHDLAAASLAENGRGAGPSDRGKEWHSFKLGTILN